MIDNVQAIVDAVNAYTASVKVSAPHCLRIKKLCVRITVLAELHNELYRRLMGDYDAVKEIMDASDDPTPPALVEFQGRYAEFNLVTKLAQEAMAEINSEKEFVDWHMATNLRPESELALKLLGMDKPPKESE